MKKLSKQSPVTLVELAPMQYGRLNGDVSYDIYSISKLPARALPILEAIIKADGWGNVESICPLDREDGKLNSENFKRIFNSDVLCLSSITRTAPQSQELARLYRLNNPKGMIIAGGFDPTFRVEDWLRHVDVIVLGEGEKTFSELMQRLTEDRDSLEDIAGLALRKNREIEITPPRKLLTGEELSQLPYPIYSPRVRRRVNAGVIETSRGCPHGCDFCTVTKIYGKRYRTKSTEYVVEGLERIKDMGEYLFFTDDNLTANPNKTIGLLGEITENKLNTKYSLCQTTVQLADNPEVMQALIKANVNALCVGIESINNNTLKDYGKPYTAEQNKKAIRTLREAGFWIHGMMMLGGKGDTPESLNETSKWINNNLDSAQLFAATPIPGSELFNQMEQQGRILTKDWFLYDGQHVVMRPNNFTPYELQKTIYEMYEDFYSVKKSLKRLFHSKHKKVSLAISGYAKLKARKMLYNPQSNDHLEFLESIS